MRKRLWSTLLMFCMILTLFPFGVFADADNQPTAISMPEKLEVYKNDSYTVRPVYTPSNSVVHLTVSSNDASIAVGHSAGSGDSWNLIGISPGETDIIVATSNGLTAVAHVTVLDSVEPNSIEMDSEITIAKDAKQYLRPTILPSNSETMFAIESSNPSVVSTFTGGSGRNYNGRYFASSVGVNGVAEGTATITVYTINGLSATTTVTVASGEAPTAVSIPKTKQLVEGASWDPPITITPENASTTFSITTEDSSVARVNTTGASSGCRVYAVNCGTTTITVYTKNGLSASCDVTVTHDWGEWTVTKEASASSPGEETRICRIDPRHVETRSIPVSGDPAEPTDQPVDDPPSQPAPTPTASPIPIDTPTPEPSPEVEPTAQPTVEPTAQPTVEPTAQPTVEPTMQPTVEPTTFPVSFADVEKDAYYADAVRWAVAHDPQITTGMDSTHFAPNRECTRAQMVTFLWRAAGCPEPESTKNPFTDVKKDAYYYDAVLWAVDQGITAGTSKNTFSPDATVTRAQTVTFLWRMEGQPEVKVKNPFKDTKSGQYYYDAVLWAVENEITTGTSATTFAPNDPCTRAQIVTFLYRDLG